MTYSGIANATRTDGRERDSDTAHTNAYIEKRAGKVVRYTGRWKEEGDWREKKERERKEGREDRTNHEKGKPLDCYQSRFVLLSH